VTQVVPKWKNGMVQDFTTGKGTAILGMGTTKSALEDWQDRRGLSKKEKRQIKKAQRALLGAPKEHNYDAPLQRDSFFGIKNKDDFHPDYFPFTFDESSEMVKKGFTPEDIISLTQTDYLTVEDIMDLVERGLSAEEITSMCSKAVKEIDEISIASLKTARPKAAPPVGPNGKTGGW
jgi:hypothetical protein